jgi:vacuolar-type H+-ATPase subunit H
MRKEQSLHPGPQEAIQRVKQAETEARRIVQNAREQESVQILQQAREESSRIREKHLSQARERAAQQRSALIEEAEAEARRIRADGEQEAGELRKAAESLIPGAVAKTADKITALLQDKPV